MNTEQFFMAVLPPTGPYVATWESGFTDKGKPILSKEHFFNTLEDLATASTQQDQQGRWVYYRTASYKEVKKIKSKAGKTKNDTSKDNSDQRKCFHVDIDVGTGKDYDTQAEAATALAAAIKALSLPTPLVVLSGFGLHVYWILTESVPVDEWQPVADIFKTKLRKDGGLKCDSPTVANAVCLLRPVGTHHRKSGTPLEVKAYNNTYAPISLENFSSLLGIADTTDLAATAAMFEMDDSLVIQYEDIPSDANAVADLCPFIQEFRETGFYSDEGGMEPKWKYAMGAVKYCIDGEAKCHEFSANAGDGYSYEDTQAKLDGWNAEGPTRCDFVEENWPEYCERCEYRGSVSTPKQLGQAQAAEEEIKQTVIDEGPWWPKGIGWDAAHKKMYIEKWDAEEGIYKDHFSTTKFYIETRIYTADDEWAFLVHRCKYVKEDDTEVWDTFTVPTGAIAKPTELAQEFAKQEVYVTARTGPANLAEVLKVYGDALRAKKIEAVEHSVMGWHAHDTDIPKTDVAYAPQADGFIIGNQLVEADGESTVLLSDHIRQDWRKGLGISGDVKTWAQFVHRALVKNNNIPAQFIMLTEFATAMAVLFGRSEYHGNLISLVAGSGIGKTTMCKLALSIWGNPDLLTLNGNPSAGITPKAFQKTLSSLRNLSPFMDEVGKQMPGILGELVYMISLGKSRGGLGTDRKPLPIDDPWFSLTKMTANKSIMQIVADDENDTEQAADAMQKRIFEINFDRLGYTKEELASDPQLSSDLQKAIDTQYGTAGRVWIRYILANIDDVIGLLSTTYEEVKARSPDHAGERFLDYLEALIIAAAKLTPKAQLFYPDLDGLIKFMKAVRTDMSSIRDDTKVPIMDAFARYLASHHTGIIRTQKFPTGKGRASGSETEFPLNEIRGEIVGRIAVKDQIAALYVTPLKDWCRKRNIDFTRMVQEMDTNGYIAHDPELIKTNGKAEPMKTAVERHSLGKGTNIASSRALCLMLDFGHIAGVANLRPVKANLAASAEEGQQA